MLGKIFLEGLALLSGITVDPKSQERLRLQAQWGDSKA